MGRHDERITPAPLAGKARLAFWLPLLGWGAVVMMLATPVLGYYRVLPSPDFPPFYRNAARLRNLEAALAAGNGLTPHALLSFLLPPLLLHDLAYFLDVLLTAAGGAFLLRGRGLPRGACWAGGGALALASYSFTLIAAGHRGYFDLAVYAVWTLAFVLRAVLSGRRLLYALAGGCAGWCVNASPDLSFLYLAVAGAYAIWLLFVPGAEAAAARPLGARLRRALARAPLALLLAALTSFGSVRHIFTVFLPHREGQIAQSSGRREAGGEGEEDVADDPAARWIFATNWSLPPEEILEFAAPCVLGRQSGDPQAPYWGRLGRTWGWERHGQGFANFRQHAVYLGGLQLMLAAFATGAWATRRRRRRRAAPPEDALPADAAAWLDDVPFWSMVALVALLLSFGRHAPFYRLFYSLPYMSLLRAPVKFIRFVELGVAMLAGTGLAVLGATAERRPALRQWMTAAAVCALLCAGGAALFARGGEPIGRRLAALGLASRQTEIQARAARAMLHGALAFGFAGLLFALAGGRRRHAALPALLASLWIAGDAFAVNRHFVQGVDVEPFYRANRIVERVLHEAPRAPVIANHAAPNTPYHWLAASFRAHGIVNCGPPARPSPGDPFVALMSALRDDPVRYWELCGASFALLPLEAAKALAGPRLEPVEALRLGDGEVLPASGPERAIMLMRVRRSLPPAWLSPAWRHVPEERHLEAVVERTGDPRLPAIVSGEGENGDGGDPAAAPGEAELRRLRFERGALATRLTTACETPQMLTVRERDNAGLAAFIDGARAPLLRSGQLWCGVPVPPGRHEVVLRSPRRLLPPLLSLCPLPLLLAAAAGTRRRGAAEE